MARRIFISASGMRISKLGRDALSANAEDLLVDTSTRNTRAYFSGRLQGTGSYNGDLTTGYGMYQVIATHGLGYIPLCNTIYVGGSVADIIVDTGRIIMQFYVNYGQNNPAPATAAAPGYVDFSVFYDQWF